MDSFNLKFVTQEDAAEVHRAFDLYAEARAEHARFQRVMDPLNHADQVAFVTITRAVSLAYEALLMRTHIAWNNAMCRAEAGAL